MNCYNKNVEKFDLVVAEDSEFDLTRDRVYVAMDSVGYNLIRIKNDLGEIDDYTTECFRFYDGESVERRFQPNKS